MSQLDHWRNCRDRYISTEEFICWLEENYHVSLDFTYAKPGTPLELRTLLNEYYDIDHIQLEKERREVLARQRALIGEDPNPDT